MDKCVPQASGSAGGGFQGRGGMVNGLITGTGGSHKADHSTVGQSRQAADAPQTNAFSIRLQNVAHLIGADLAAIVNGVKAVGESPLALGTAVTLAAFGSFPVFVGYGMSAQGAVHRFLEESLPFCLSKPTGSVRYTLK